MGLVFAISPGVVPNEMDFQAGLIHSASLSKLLCQRNMSLGEVGCAIAHKNAMTNFLNSDHKFGVIFEDDAEIIADFDFDVVIKLLDSNVPKTIALGWIPGFAIAKDPMDPLSEEPIELITSPTVYSIESGVLIPIEINTNTYEVRKSVNDGASQLVIDIEYSFQEYATR